MKKTHYFFASLFAFSFAMHANAQGTEPTSVDGVYQISTASELEWFSTTVNAGNKDINAVLTNDIVVNTNVLTDHVLNEGEFSQWTPIGSGGYSFGGTFDGNGYTVSGLYNTSGTSNLGLFGNINGATIKNIGVSDTYFKCGDCSGGVAGFCYDGLFTIENCWFDGLIESTGYDVAGVFGGTWSSKICTIKNCYNLGTVTSSSDCVGGISGYCRSTTTISNCFNYGHILGECPVGGILGEIGATIVNCYYLKGSATSSYGVAQNGISNKSDLQGVVVAATAEQFASGEVCYLLNDDQSSIAFGQTIGTGLPSLLSDNRVYVSYTGCKSDAVFTNNPAEVVKATRHSLTAVADVAPVSGVSHGVVAHYKCSVCGELFSDNLGRYNIASPEEIHDIVYVETTAPVAGVSHGLESHYECSVCKAMYSDEYGERPASEKSLCIHDIVYVEPVAPVAGESHGTTEHYECSVCKAMYSDEYGERPASEKSLYIHDLVHIDATLPVAGESHGTAEHYKCSICDAMYDDIDGSNAVTTTQICIHDFASGLCTVCSQRNSDYVPVLTPDDENVYQIATLDDLLDFAMIVNAGNTDFNAVLTNDIVVNANVLTDHELNNGIFIEWTPIGTLENPYHGSFDGQGHTVSGLYNDKRESLVGFFGHIGNATIKNLGVNDTYFYCHEFSGGIAGFSANDDQEYTFTIENCWFDGLIESTGYDIGGILGGSWSESDEFCHINNCYNLATIRSVSDCIGGISGYNGNTIVSNCFNYGQISGTDDTGAIIGEGGSDVLNCYYLEGSAMIGDEVQGGIGDESDAIGYVESATAGQFASGEVCYKLNGNQTNIVFHQNIGTGSVAPDFSSTGVILFDGTSYSNDPQTIPSAISTVKVNKAPKAIKTIENGRIVIIRGNDKFDLMGRKL